ncbi:hypothetical protein V3M69_07445 [Trueperella pyogenes]|uniref:Uncharacterized protein n=1 Tax=Trueperella pyogenes TaxID=1661 RepID=A0A3Q9GMS1_9ACTO|nr:hypothetical protein [Trueperella pyogenes]AZR07113.1 hypothetical protein EBQ10_07265 [Trueperella pyogenes]MCI7689678.1 hypothetical protein [Trueperella pyogenes]
MASSLQFRFEPYYDQQVAATILSITHVSTTGMHKHACSVLLHDEVSLMSATITSWLQRIHPQQPSQEPDNNHHCTSLQDLDVFNIWEVHVDLRLSVCPECGKLYLFVTFLSDQRETIGDSSGLLVDRAQLQRLARIINKATDCAGYCTFGAQDFSFTYSIRPAVTITRDRLVVHTPIEQQYPVTVHDAQWHELLAFAEQLNDDEVDLACTTTRNAGSCYVTLSATQQPDDLFFDDHFISTVNIRVFGPGGGAGQGYSFMSANSRYGTQAVTMDGTRAMVFNGLSFHFVP